MIEYYEIRKVNKEKVLVLYLSYDYEFGGTNKETSILNKINTFIKTNIVKWNGNKVILVVGGLVLGSLVLGKIDIPNNNGQDFNYVSSVILNHFDEDNNEIGYSKVELPEPEVIVEEKEETTIEEEKENSVSNNISNNNTNKEEIVKPTPPTNNSNNTNGNNNNNSSNNNQVQETKTMVTIYRSNGTIETLELEEYLIGVVAIEMPASFNIETLKAQSIAARTYALKAIQENKVLTDDVKTQSYRDNNQLRVMWGNSFDTYYNKVKKAVEATKGQVITYNNQYIDAVYHSTSNGYTESSYEVFGYNHPYLVSVNSSWDINATSFLRETSFTFDNLQKILGINFNSDTLVEVISRTPSGRVSRLRINDNYYSGIEFRNLLGLRSADFDINVSHDKVIITTRGYGHGVGMSQYGANGMANNGKTYVEILKHYYPGTTIKAATK